MTITSNQVVAVCGLLLSVTVFTMLNKYGVPSRICWGAAILSILVVAIFWSTAMLGTDDEEQE